MPSRDVTGNAAMQAAATIKRLRLRMDEYVPLGPTREKMTNKEALLSIQGMDAAVKTKLINEIGPEEWERKMEMLYGTRS